MGQGRKGCREGSAAKTGAKASGGQEDGEYDAEESNSEVRCFDAACFEQWLASKLWVVMLLLG